MALTKVQTEMAGTGAVLQVVSVSFGTQTSTTSTTPVTSGLTATITPKFATSKILILINAYGYANSANVASMYTTYRNSTNLNTVGRILNGSNNIQGAIAINYLDSPATTSATTYTLYMYTQSTTAYLNTDSTSSNITLMEIAV